MLNSNLEMDYLRFKYQISFFYISLDERIIMLQGGTTDFAEL